MKEIKGCFENDIAIVGLSIRTPLGEDYEEFWNNLENGESSIKEVHREGWKINGKNNYDENKQYASLFTDPFKFDYNFFNISPNEAKELDLQQRYVLEEGYKCIEESGIALSELQENTTGVYVGVTSMEFVKKIGDENKKITSYTGTGYYSFMLANRFSNFFNLTGESKVVDTACSSSLSALHDAILSLQSGICKYAIVIGVNCNIDGFRHYMWYKNRMVSQSGICSPFSSESDGTVFGEGIGVLLLKRKSDAIKDNDNIRAIIKGIAANHCGRTKTISSPSVKSQIDLLRKAYAKSEVNLEDVSYIETHGTATPLGDPIEFEALKNVFKNVNLRCNLGSLKANIGHTTAASGILSIIKVTLMLCKKAILPQINFKDANPTIDLKNSKFEIVTTLKKWDKKDEKLLTAGVSSFGLGGSNVHVILQEYENKDNIITNIENTYYPFILSAKSNESLKMLINSFKEYSTTKEFFNTNVRDICYTLLNRKSYDFRIGCIVKNHEDINEFLNHVEIKKNSIKKKLVFNSVNSINREIINNEQLPWIMNKYKEIIEKYSLDNSLNEKNHEKLFSYLNNYIIIDKLKKSGLEFLEVSGINNGVLLSLVFSGIISLEDSIKLILNEKNIKEVELKTPNIDYYDDKSKKLIKSIYIEENNIKDLFDFSINEECFEELFKKTKKLYKQNFTFKKYSTDWIEELKVYGFDISEKSINITDSKVKKAAIILMYNSIYLLYKKWDIQFTIQNVDKKIKEISYLIEDSIIKLKDITDILLRDKNEHFSKICNHINNTSNFKKDKYEFLNRNLNFENYKNLIIKKYEDIEENKELLNENYIKLSDFNLDKDFSSFLDKIVNLWVQGSSLKIIDLIEHTNYKKVSLPTYKFDKTEILLDIKQTKDISKKETSVELINSTWIEDNILEKEKYDADILLFDDNLNLYNELKNKNISNIKCIINSNNFKKVNEDIYEISMNKESIEYILKLIINKDTNLIIIYNSSEKETIINESNVRECIENIYLEVFKVLKSILNYKQNLRFIYLDKEKNENILIGSIEVALRSIMQEYNNLFVKTILVDNISKEIDNIINEIFTKNLDVAIKYFDNKRYIKKLNTLSIDSNGKGIKEYKKAIVFGGLGKLGIILSRWLNKNNIEVFISGRKSKEEAEEIICNNNINAQYLNADIANENEVKNIFEKLENVDIVFNCAGLIRDSLLINKTIEEIRAVLDSKVYGNINILKYAKKYNVKEVILYSSIAGVVGNIGQFDYSFANAFINEYTNILNKVSSNNKFKSISWGYWNEGGMQLSESEQNNLFDKLGIDGIANKDAFEQLEKIIASYVGNVCVLKCNKEKLEKAYVNKNIKIESKGIRKTLPKGKNVRIFVENTIKEALEQVTGFSKDNIDLEDEIDVYGFNSLLITDLIDRISTVLNIKLSVTIFFSLTNMMGLVNYILQNFNIDLANEVDDSKDLEDYTHNNNNNNNEENTENDIAIIGVSGQYPKANTIEEFWNNIKNKVDCITDVPDDRWSWEKYYNSEITEAYNGYIYCKNGGFINDAYKFDNELFNILPREAKLIDPQERRFMQVVWEALEKSGYCKTRLINEYDGKVGVFVGSGDNSYIYNNISDWENVRTDLAFSYKFAIANRISYYFNWNGPSIAIDTACSSSIAALNYAYKSLKNNECEIAIVGGVNIYTHPAKYLLLCQKQMLSKTGRCHTFSNDADGFVPGEGVGAIVLKSLSKAKRDKDNILAVIKGTSINHGGKTSGFYVPNLKAQESLISETLEKSNLVPNQITHIETHGTGTKLGDPIEVQAIQNVFDKGKNRGKSCSISSVKSNIGHLESAAGIASITKAILELKNKKLVPSININKINSEINLEDSCVYVQRELEEWNIENITDKRRVLVSSFGAGGVNVNTILEEYIKEDLSINYEPIEDLFVLSAMSKNQLIKYATKMIKFIKENAFIDENEKKPKLYKKLVYILSEILDIDSDELFPDFNLGEIDTYELHKFKNVLSKEFQISVDWNISIDSLTLKELVDKLENIVESNSYNSLNFNDICYTLQIGREEMDYRLAIIAKDVNSLLKELQHFIKSEISENIFYGKKHDKIVIHTDDIREIGELWVNGGKFDFAKLNIHKNSKIISLPTYPFNEMEFRINDKEETSKYIYVPKYKKVEDYEINKDIIYKKNLFIYPSNTNINKYNFEDYLNTSFIALNENNENSILEILSKYEFENIVFLNDFSYDREILDIENKINSYKKCLLNSGVMLLRIFKALTNLEMDNKSLNIKVITLKDSNYEGNNYLRSVEGLIKVAIKEYPNWKLTSFYVDVNTDLNRILYYNLPSNIYIVMNNQIYIEELVREKNIEISYSNDYKENSVFILLGGNGRIGETFSYHLAKKKHMKIVIVGRSNENDRIIEQLNRIKDLGSEGIYYKADVTNYREMMKLFAVINMKYGKIDAIVNSVMCFKTNLIKDITEDEYKEIFYSKVISITIINELANKYNINQIISFSSSDVFGGLIAHGSYVSACYCQDKYMLSLNCKNIKVINWGFWSINKKQINRLQENNNESIVSYINGLSNRGINPITEKVGMESIDIILKNSKFKQVAVMDISDKVLNDINKVKNDK